MLWKQNAKWIREGIRETLLFSEPGLGRATVNTNYFPGVVRRKISQYTEAFKDGSHSSLPQMAQLYGCFPNQIIDSASSALWKDSWFGCLKLYGHFTFKPPFLVWHDFPLLLEQQLIFLCPYYDLVQDHLTKNPSHRFLPIFFVFSPFWPSFHIFKHAFLLSASGPLYMFILLLTGFLLPFSNPHS